MLLLALAHGRAISWGWLNTAVFVCLFVGGGFPQKEKKMYIVEDEGISKACSS